MKFKIKVFVVASNFLALLIFVSLRSKSTSIDPLPLKSLCGKRLKESEIVKDNEIWQIMQTHCGTIKLLNAYLDLRWNISQIRIFASGPKLKDIKGVTIFCQLWYDGLDEPKVTIALNPILLRFQRKLNIKIKPTN